jgi:hypothetical protein
MKVSAIRQARRLLLGLGLFAAATAAHAQATRTWVSGVGDDVNPCSRTAPCKTFAGAISKTSANGIISVLDPGGFGAVTITKSITIDGGGIEGSILASGTTGVLVNGANVVVTLRNLSIDGAHATVPGLVGVRFLNGSELHIENCYISGFRGANGDGIRVNPTTAGVRRLYVRETTITNNGSGAATEGGGIRIVPTGGAIVFANVENSRVQGNNGYGIKAQDNSFVAINTTRIDGNRKSGVAAVSTSSLVDMVVNNSVLHDSGWDVGVSEAAVLSSGSLAVVHLSKNVLSNNAQAIRRPAGGQVFSTGDNTMLNNTVAGSVNGADAKL